MLNPALLNNCIRLAARPSAKKKLNNIPQPARDIVEEILRIARPEIAAGDHHLGPAVGCSGREASVSNRLERRDAWNIGIFEQELDLGHA